MSLLVRATLVVSCATLAVCGAAGAAGSSRSPTALVAALLKTRVTANQLPHGYGSPAVGSYELTAATKKHHGVGGVVIVADGGSEEVIYIVFATAADAKLDWDNANFSGMRTSAAPSSIPKPSIVVNTTATGKSGRTTVKVGVTDISCLQGNVIVQAGTSSTTNPNHGDVAGAVALERFAIAHLASLR